MTTFFLLLLGVVSACRETYKRQGCISVVSACRETYRRLGYLSFSDV